MNESPVHLLRVDAPHLAPLCRHRQGRFSYRINAPFDTDFWRSSASDGYFVFSVLALCSSLHRHLLSAGALSTELVPKFQGTLLCGGETGFEPAMSASLLNPAVACQGNLVHLVLFSLFSGLSCPSAMPTLRRCVVDFARITILGRCCR